ncbi:hypothetical protein ACOMHN_053221 [Nucella lapillus]
MILWVIGCAWSVEDDKGVSCLHFLKLRSRQRRGANLVVGGPYGHIAMWNINFAREASAPMAFFPASEDSKGSEVVSVTAMDSDVDNSLLAIGDSKGTLTLWDIQHYALEHPEQDPPPCPYPLRTAHTPLYPSFFLWAGG